MFRLLTALLVLLPLTACGQNRYAPRTGALKPEYYVLDPDDRPGQGEHLRYAPAGERAGGLDIAVTTYVHPESDIRVALFGVVHVADAPYYERVKRELDEFDVVLYEGVKPEALTAEEWQASFNKGEGEVASLQRRLAKWFGFQYQLDAIDYTAENFVHADMTEQEFLDGGGGILMPGRKTAEKKDPTDAEAKQPAGLDYGMGERSLTTAVDGTLKAVEAFGEEVLGKPGILRSMARRMFAETMGTADIGTALDMFPGLGDLVLIKRNEIVVKHLEEALRERPRTIAIFYGAAHMDDLEQRLTRDLGFQREAAHWLRAWALRPPLKP